MDIYNINIDCNYRSFDDEKEADLVYKKNIIEVFNLQEDILNNELFEMMSKKIEDLKKYLEENDLFKHIEELVNDASKIFIMKNVDVGMMMLFSYDFFDMFHNVLVSILRDKELNVEAYNILKNHLPK